MITLREVCITTEDKVRVIIADDSLIFRESMKMLLSQDPGISVVALASNGSEAFDLCCKHRPDIVIMDVRMPVCDGIEGTRLIKNHMPEVKVIMFTTFEDEDYITEAIKHGAEGYVLKDSGQEHIRMVIKSVYKGYPVFHEKVLNPVIQSLSENRTEKVRMDLSQVEKQILKLVVEGKSNKQIGNLLMLSEGRIKNIISELFEKTNTGDRTQLAVFAVRNDLVD
ncbi:MAG: response regulator transcription factor [Clostridiaceae bacterium]|jgi:DNA-binding NarL/FixJ family response regulator|nr:response regulator transcription factor [Clostridiaceae bacterium]